MIKLGTHFKYEKVITCNIKGLKPFDSNSWCNKMKI